MTESINAPKNTPGTGPGPGTDGTRFTGQELETLPGAKDALTLLDEVVAATGGQNRAGQRTMVAHVAQALELQRHLLVQASGLVFGEFINSLHDFQFIFRIYRCCRFIKNNNRCIFQNCSCNRNALFFSPG